MAKRDYVEFLLDRSGSMTTIKDETITLFNSFLGDNRDTRISITQFDSEGIETLFDAVKAEDAAELNEDTFLPRGMTPLFDAIGRRIVATDEYLKENGKKRNVVFAIMTDGHENASHEYTSRQVFDMIREREERGWQFIYLGANQDAYAVGQALGIQLGTTVTYDSASVADAGAILTSATSSYRSTGRTVSRSVDVTSGTSEEEDV